MIWWVLNSLQGKKHYYSISWYVGKRLLECVIFLLQSLEHQLGNILRSSFDQCPTVASQLRLLEVFEGVSRRDIVKVI